MVSSGTLRKGRSNRWNIAEHFLNVRIALVTWLKSWWLYIKANDAKPLPAPHRAQQKHLPCWALKCAIVTPVRDARSYEREASYGRAHQEHNQSVNSTLEQRCSNKVIASLFEKARSKAASVISPRWSTSVQPVNSNICPTQTTVANNNKVHTDLQPLASFRQTSAPYVVTPSFWQYFYDTVQDKTLMNNILPHTENTCESMSKDFAHRVCQLWTASHFLDTRNRRQFKTHLSQIICQKTYTYAENTPIMQNITLGCVKCPHLSRISRLRCVP